MHTRLWNMIATGFCNWNIIFIQSFEGVGTLEFDFNRSKENHNSYLISLWFFKFLFILNLVSKYVVITGCSPSRMAHPQVESLDERTIQTLATALACSGCQFYFFLHRFSCCHCWREPAFCCCLAYKDGKHIAARIIYKCLLHWHAFKSEGAAVFYQVIEAINDVLKLK